MKGFRLQILASMVALAACTPSPQTGPAEGERARAEGEVRDAVAQLTAAMSSQDPDRVFSFYRESPEFVLVGCTSLMFGTEFFTRVLRPHLEAPSAAPLEREILRVQMLDSTTAVVTLQGGEEGGPHIFWTLVWIREGGGPWLVAHEHQSWPGCREPARVHTFGEPGGDETPE